MVDEAHTSLAALVIAIVALFIASVQLLQQLFGTADGYRRCQESIIGPWSGLTRLSWRWSEFRFETKYTTPLIVSYDTDDVFKDPRIVGINDKAPPKELQQTIHNCDHEVCNRPTARWRQRLCAVRARRRRWVSTSPGDQVSWTLFLRMIHERQARWRLEGSSPGSEKQAFEMPLMPPSTVERDVGVVYVERSWDLMIPEVTRPLATSTLGDIVVIAHRMGMRWLDLRFSEGFLRAEGNGHSLTATLLRGLGPVFQYSFEKKAPAVQMHEINGGEPAFEWVPGKDALVPTKESDMMACGILVGDPMLGLPNLHLAGSDDAETHHLLRLALIRFGVDKNIATRLSDGYSQRGIVNGWQSRASFALGDLVGLVSPFIPLPGSDINLIVNPIRTSQVGSSFLFWETREIFLLRLKEMVQQQQSADIPISGRSNISMICDYLTELHDNYPDDFFDRWENDPYVKQSTGRTDATSSHINTAKQRYIQRLYEMHSRTTQYFSERPEHLKFLVAEYINLAAEAWPRAIENTRQGKARDTKGRFEGPCNQWHENGHVLLDSLDEFIDKMQGRFGGREGAVDAWWMMVLRGVTWYMSVWITVPTSLVPSYCYASQSVVYLS
ncbi:uncharacterized protein LDX57_005792 [Aspergillus melleus]|uniref:uncharacterized protein n=1 Tax=Aspergillus melleus TaxID=138277 RepID=UPI001E8D8BB6|nr:uncharacterized protein LDX57_005792 [Aspergillus melleus]KAH8428087.1 hypothetical protein LDX57_005792 [Aspergillus melleus]